MSNKSRSELLTEIASLTFDIRNNATIAGCGGVGVGGENPIGTVNATPVTIDGFDTELISNPRGVTCDIANDAMIMNLKGVWIFMVKLSLEFNEASAGRKISLQAYNLDKATPSTEIFTFFVGRNAGGVNMAINFPIDIDANAVGDRIQVQILSAADTFTNAVDVGSTFSVTNNAPVTELF